MISLLATVLGTQLYRESDQLKTFLPNGSIVFCENRRAPYVSVQLILSNRDFPDQRSNYGYRHLLEHIAARSIKGHDYDLETSGGFLFASTSRDWLKFEWRVVPEKLGIAYKGISRILKDCGANEESIKRESLAIKHELALATSIETSSKDAWAAIYGESGLDPVGSEESVKTATPADLVSLWQRMTKGSNVVVSACGPLDPKTFTANAKDILSGLVTSKPGKIPTRAIEGSYGSRAIVAVPVPPFPTKGSINALVAAFGLAGRLNRPFVVYTPSLQPGVALIGSNDPFQSIKEVAEAEDPATIFALGRTTATQWLRAKAYSVEGSAEFNGTLLSLSPTLRPAKLSNEFELASYVEFKRYWDLIREVAK
jgi:hypothetical protein